MKKIIVSAIIFSLIFSSSVLALSNVTLEDPTDNDFISYLTFVWATTDEIADNATFWYSNDSSDLYQNVICSGNVYWLSFGCRFYAGNLPEGAVYNFTVNASKDNVTVTDSSYNVTTDFTPPTITFLSLNKEYATNNDNVSDPDYKPPFNITYSITENISKIAYVDDWLFGPSKNRKLDQMYYYFWTYPDEANVVHSHIWNGKEFGLNNSIIFDNPMSVMGDEDYTSVPGYFDENGNSNYEEATAFFNSSTNKLDFIYCRDTPYYCNITNGTSIFTPIIYVIENNSLVYKNTTSLFLLDENGNNYNLELYETKSRHALYATFIDAEDSAGNGEFSSDTYVTLTMKIPNGFDNISFESTANQPLTLDATEDTDTLLNLTFDEDILSLISFAKYINSTDLGVPDVENYTEIKYVEIESMRFIFDYLTNGEIRIYYNESELEPEGLSENLIKIYKYNETGDSWIELDTTVNQDENYASADVDDFSLFVLVSNPQPPQYSNEKTNPSSEIEYEPNQDYQFNITWTDDYGISEVIFEFNGTSYSYLAGEIDVDGDIYYKTLTDLAANESGYQYKWYANDTNNNSAWNSTDMMSYVINKAPGLTLTPSPGWAVTYPTQTTVNCSSNTPEIENITLYRNNVNVSIPDVQTLNPGTHNYVCNTTDSPENYTSEVSHTLTVNLPQTPSPPPGPGGSPPSAPEFKITDTNDVSINAGESGTSDFTVKNTLGFTLLDFEVTLSGVPALWYTTNAPEKFDTELTKTLTITFNVPSDAEVREYPITITARGTRPGGTETKEATGEMTLTVLSGVVTGEVPPTGEVITPTGPTGMFILGDYSWLLGIIALLIVLFLFFYFKGKKRTIRRKVKRTKRKLK